MTEITLHLSYGLSILSFSAFAQRTVSAPHRSWRKTMGWVWRESLDLGRGFSNGLRVTVLTKRTHFCGNHTCIHPPPNPSSFHRTENKWDGIVAHSQHQKNHIRSRVYDTELGSYTSSLIVLFTQLHCICKLIQHLYCCVRCKDESICFRVVLSATCHF